MEINVLLEVDRQEEMVGHVASAYSYSDILSHSKIFYENKFSKHPEVKRDFRECMHALHDSRYPGYAQAEC